MTSRMKLVAAVFVFLLLFVGFKTETISVLLSGDTEALKALSQGNLLLILLLTLLLMTIQNMFTIIPLILLISVNVALFGFAGGYLWSWLVSIAGAVVSFFITRYWFQGFFAKYVHKQWENKIEENGFWFVFFGRVMPFMPTSVVNIAAGISSVRFNKFFYATVLGNFIYFFFLSAISLGILSIPWDNGIYIGLAVVGLATILLIKRKKRKAPIIESSD
jgi:uncharacterized membrane protein YdjX (TVP38/TMEM64 family)